MKKLFLSVAVVMFLVFSFGMANANLIVNGSFEDPVIVDHDGRWQYFDDALVPGWSSENDIELQNHLLFGDAADGVQYLELDSKRQDGNLWVTQTFDTEVGQKYTFRFAFSPREGREENKLEAGIWSSYGDHWLVSDNSITASGIGLNGTDWEYYSYTFIADADHAMVAFRDIGVDDSYGTFVDDVSVVSTPEPATLLLLGTGLIGLAGFGRKKFRK